MGIIQVTIDADLKPIIPRYFEIQRAELVQLEQAIDQKDAEAARFLGHKLKGSGSSYGFFRLTELGAAIECAARAGDILTCANYVEELRNYIENVQISYQDHE